MMRSGVRPDSKGKFNIVLCDLLIIFPLFCFALLGAQKSKNCFGWQKNILVGKYFFGGGSE